MTDDDLSPEATAEFLRTMPPRPKLLPVPKWHGGSEVPTREAYTDHEFEVALLNFHKHYITQSRNTMRGYFKRTMRRSRSISEILPGRMLNAGRKILMRVALRISRRGSRMSTRVLRWRPAMEMPRRRSRSATNRWSGCGA
jgi:hypothetical protein